MLRRLLDKVALASPRIGAAWRTLASELSASFDPQSPADVRLVDEQIAIARRSSWTTVYVIPAAALAIAYANRNWASERNLFLWPILVALTCIGTELLFRLLNRDESDPSPDAVRKRARHLAAWSSATSLAWVAMTVFLWAPGQPLNHMFLILVIASTISGWSSLGASHLATAFAAMPIYLLVPLGMTLGAGDSLDLALGLLSVGYWMIMAVLLHANYKTREHLLRLENERTALIDDLRRAKAESDQARVRAEAASHAKSSFLANMSHELRTPLNAILGFSEIIHTRALGAAAQSQYAEYGGFIHESGKHLLALINDILDLAKIESGRFTLREDEVDLARLTREAVQMLAIRADAAGITLACDTAPDLPNVQGDERALRQILVNLLSNAVKFTPEKGRVTVFASRTSEGGVCFGVSDNGIGIEADDLARVFENFGQGRHDAVIADQGTGLGLPIVKGLAQAHDGDITLESAPGRGTRATIVLPASRVREVRATAA